MNSIAYIDMWRHVPSLGDLALSLELVRLGCGLHNVLSINDDDISTAVGVFGSDIIIGELCVLGFDNDLVGTTSGSRVGRENRLQLTVGGGVTGRGGGGHFGYEEGINQYREEGRLMFCERACAGVLVSAVRVMSTPELVGVHAKEGGKRIRVLSWDAVR